MSMITDEQRARYIAAQKALGTAEELVWPAVQAIESTAGIPALRDAFNEIQESIGEELMGACIFCDAPIFTGDDYVSGDEIMCDPCNEKAWAEMTPEDRAARLAEIEAGEMAAPPPPPRASDGPGDEG